MPTSLLKNKPPGRVLAQPGACLYAPLAQLVEQLTLNQWVLGSSPRWCTTKYLAQSCGVFFYCMFLRELLFPCTSGDENGLVRGQEQKRKSRKTSGGKFFGFLLFLLNGGNNTIGLLTVICIIETIGNHFIDFLLGHFSFTFIKNNKIN